MARLEARSGRSKDLEVWGLAMVVVGARRFPGARAGGIVTGRVFDFWPEMMLRPLGASLFHCEDGLALGVSFSEMGDSVRCLVR